MKAKSGRPRPRYADRARALLVCAAVIGAVTLAGCGSSKPAYCTDRANLENSIKGLTSVNLISSGGVSALTSQVKTIASDADALANSAKSDFPTQTSAISSSVKALESSVTALASSPSAAQIATVTKDAASAVSSVKSFADATSSQCG
jgi:outer membrane murein-binding lipoprotein Lpp